MPPASAGKPSASSSQVPLKKTANPADPPYAFRPCRDQIDGFQSITCAPEHISLSFEELRIGQVSDGSAVSEKQTDTPKAVELPLANVSNSAVTEVSSNGNQANAPAPACLSPDTKTFRYEEWSKTPFVFTPA